MLRWLFCLLCLCIATAEAQNDVERLKVGLVLGGGGAKGACEIGVLKSIEKSGIPIDYIAGTSIGSIIGGLYSIGYCSAQIDTLFRSQDWLKLFTQEILEKDHIVEFLDSLTGYSEVMDFDSLPIPFRCVAVDVRQQKEVVMCRGRISVAMRASMAIPGVFRPVRSDSMVLVDGGVLNNLPVDVVKQMGADVVIAVDLTQNKHQPRSFSLKDTFGIGGILHWLVSRPDWGRYHSNRKQVDLYINPELPYGVASFGKAQIEEMITIGEKAGRDQQVALEQLRKRVYHEN